MVVLDLKLDNFYAFKNFHINLTYPKRIVDSSIKDEHLKNRNNFRYKKVNVLLGSNASGKTTLGLIIMNIFNFIDKKNYVLVTDAISDPLKEASFTIDLASDDNLFYRVKCIIDANSSKKYEIGNIHVEVRKEKINVRDSYESCVKRIENAEYIPAENYISELEKIGALAWLFDYPKDYKQITRLPNNDNVFKIVLENILKSLDPSIEEITISQDVENGYVIKFRGQSLVIQNGQRLDTELLSSGTKSGISIANIVSSLIQKQNSFYYCDEKFSFIHTDLEKAILSLMTDYVDCGEQLFFTTHNTDILDMNLPKHAFSFLKKDTNNDKQPIVCIEASSLLKRNTDSLRRAVENDLFSTAPDVDLIYSIGNMFTGEVKL